MCAEVSKTVVIGYLQLLLKGARLESTTEESLHTKLSSHFQQDMRSYYDDIHAEVEKFIVMSATNGLEERRKRGRENCEPDALTAKRTRVNEDAAEPLEFVLSEDGLTRCNICEVSGTVHVDIRTCIQQAGKMQPSKNGITLTIPEWRTLSTALSGLCEAIEKKDLSHTVPLGGKRRVTIIEPDGDVIAVDIRNYFGPSDRPQPSRSGLTLRAAAVKVLCEFADSITAALLRRPDNAQATAYQDDVPAMTSPVQAEPQSKPPVAPRPPKSPKPPREKGPASSSRPPPAPKAPHAPKTSPTENASRPPKAPRSQKAPHPEKGPHPQKASRPQKARRAARSPPPPAPTAAPQPPPAPLPLPPPPPPTPDAKPTHPRTHAPAAAAPNTAAQPPAAHANLHGSSKGGALPKIPTKTGVSLWRIGEVQARNVVHAGISEFQGRRLVTVREHFLRDGEWFPGRRGINITPEQLRTLCMHEKAISKAVAAKDTSLRFALSDTRVVLLGFEANVLYVNLREIKERSKQSVDKSCRPRGIGLSVAEWRNLATVLPHIFSSL